ncbi:MAG: aldehyde dehydrogenase family protein, partial [Mycobacteriales bacterium]
MNSVTVVPTPTNEPVRQYAPGSAERSRLEARLKELAAERHELSMTIAGREVTGAGESIDVVAPHQKALVLGTARNATTDEVSRAIAAAKDAAPQWAAMSYDDRAAVFLTAADLIAGPWRDTLNAATMLGQSKTVIQAEIDAACEFIDFLRFNVAYGRQILADQPQSSPGIWNRMDYRPLEGFVLAITPFNFTAIA